MLFTLTSLALAVALPTAAQALGNAVVTNKCSSNVYLWSVGGSVGSKVTLAPGTSYWEQYHTDATTGGIALKITTVDNGLYMANTAQTIFSYALQGSQVYADMSDVFGDAFAGKSLTIKSTDPNAPSISWPNGTPPAGSQVRAVPAGADTTLTLCG